MTFFPQCIRNDFTANRSWKMEKVRIFKPIRKSTPRAISFSNCWLIYHQTHHKNQNVQKDKRHLYATSNFCMKTNFLLTSICPKTARYLVMIFLKFVSSHIQFIRRIGSGSDQMFATKLNIIASITLVHDVR